MKVTFNYNHNQKNKIEAIKNLREAFNFSLVEGKDIVDQVWEGMNVVVDVNVEKFRKNRSLLEKSFIMTFDGTILSTDEILKKTINQLIEIDDFKTAHEVMSLLLNR